MTIIMISFNFMFSIISILRFQFIFNRGYLLTIFFPIYRWFLRRNKRGINILCNTLQSYALSLCGPRIRIIVEYSHVIDKPFHEQWNNQSLRPYIGDLLFTSNKHFETYYICLRTIQSHRPVYRCQWETDSVSTFWCLLCGTVGT